MLNKYRYSHAMALRKWKKQSPWGAYGGLNHTKHCSNVWLQCTDSNAPGTTRPPNRERKRPPKARSTTSTSTTQRQDQQMRVNHLRDMILTATETSKQTIRRHGWIHTCIGRNYTTQQDASCCLQQQRERQCVCEWSVGKYCGSFHAEQYPQRKWYSSRGWC